MSNGVLRARVEQEGCPIKYYEAVFDLCDKAFIRELESRVDSRVRELACDDGVGWRTMVSRIVDIRRKQIEDGDGAEINTSVAGEIKTVFGWGLTDNQAKAIYNRIDDARIARLLSAYPQSFIKFEYKDRTSYVAFEQASPGQQASALLTLLLNQEAGTLIIDQPEDDLDNKTVMDIVELLQATKRKRQLIFATHNPNFVVNGDADKIVVLVPLTDPDAVPPSQQKRIQIECDGAIETSIVRDSITEVMEGGKRAFELRGRKYYFNP